MRTSKTILLEGPSDKRVLSALLKAFKARGVFPEKEFIVDTASTIKAEGRGNRELVEYLYQEALVSQTPIVALVDREYRDFILPPNAGDPLSRHKQVSHSLFWTRGHSIENYFFKKAYFLGFLSFAYPESISNASVVEVNNCFDRILAWSACVGLSAFQHQLISKLNGALSRQAWQKKHTGDIEIDLAYLESLLLKRGVSEVTATSFAKDVLMFLGEDNLKPGSSLNRWLCHGHIGNAAAWSGIGRILEIEGVAPSVVDSVSQGEVDTKIRYFGSQWASASSNEEDEYPVELVKFLSGF